LAELPAPVAVAASGLAQVDPQMDMNDVDNIGPDLTTAARQTLASTPGSAMYRAKSVPN